MENEILVYMADNDIAFLKTMQEEFAGNPELKIRIFETGEKCLEQMWQEPDIVVLDYFLNSLEKDPINGLEILKQIKRDYPALPVIMLSAQDNIEIAINCLKHKAFDYIVKSETAFIRLQKTITTILLFKKMGKTLSWYQEKL